MRAVSKKVHTNIIVSLQSERKQEYNNALSFFCLSSARPATNTSSLHGAILLAYSRHTAHCRRRA